MPRLAENATTLGDLRRELALLLPNAQLEVQTIDSAEEPLLFLFMPHAVAAFALAGSDPKASYDRLYAGFKKYCTGTRREWDGLEVVFVFGVRPPQPDLDQLASSIETDVYFCRKFVIRIAPDLALALARLPFLPLTSSLPHISMRPTSAQTLLQRCGMHTELAKNLVVQGKRGHELIVGDCVQNLYGSPTALEVPSSLPPSPYEANATSVRLKSMTIENFRAYRTKRTFELGRKVTILYGPNGFGKTSFFDAVDFALTGDIGRLNLSDSAFIRAARHLDAGTEDAGITAFFESADREKKLTRKVASPKQAQIDDRPTERKAVLTQLTGGQMTSADRVENFINLFRATHLFNQEDQELMKDFSKTSELPEPIVSRMLAFEDYTNAVAKATAVRKSLAERVQTAEAQRQALLTQLESDRQELAHLTRIAENVPSPETLATELSALHTRLEANQVPIADDPQPASANIATIRSWRGAVEIAHGESRIRGEKLIALTTDFARRPQVKAELDSIREQIAAKDEAATTAGQTQARLEEYLARHEAALKELILRRDEEEKRVAALHWVRDNRTQFARLLQRQNALTTEMQALATLIDGDREAETKVTSKKRDADVALRERQARLANANQLVASLRGLSESLPGWASAQSRLAQLRTTEQTHNDELARLQQAEPALATTLQNLKSQDEKLRRDLSTAEASQTELTNLLAQLQTHVTNGFCLACGVDHGSKGELLARMRSIAHTNSAAERIRSDLTDTRTKLEQATTASAENRQKREAVNVESRELTGQRQGINQAIEEFEELAASLGFSSFDTALVLRDAITARQRQAQAEVESVTGQVSTATNDVQQAETALRTTKASLQGRIEDASAKRIELAQVETDLAAFREDPRQIPAPFDSDQEQLDSLLLTAEQDLVERREETSQAELTVSGQRPPVASAKQEVATLKSQLATLRGQLPGLQRTLNEFEARFEDSGLSPDTDEQALQRRVSTETARQTQLTEIIETAANLEIAMDAVTTAAALRQMQQNVRAKEEAMNHEATDKGQCEPWQRYFDSAIKILSAEKDKAIANFTKAYGPRTSIIQARLRSVYGFEDIEMQTRNGKIIVRVRRNGEELRPIDYFSQSQIQTLLLGLFLAASTSQTWSGFCPVLLDDPVTHFDDLNVYSFLDLIAGLIGPEGAGRQFIISTCDQKLMKLARQKFRNEDGSVVFYRFSDIGRDGPSVEKMTFG